MSQIKRKFIEDAAVNAAKLASDAVTTVKILDSNVTANKLATDAVTSAKIAADAVTTVKILDANVTAAKLASDSVTTVKILDANVTAAKLASDSVTTAKILDANVTSAKIQSSVALAGVPTAATASLGTNTTQLATTAFVQAATSAAAAGLQVKQSVRAASTVADGNYDLASSPSASVDSVSLVTGDRVLLKHQTAPAENGIYVYTSTGGGTFARSSDADISAEVTAGMFTFVEEGSVNADTGWVLSTDNPIVLNTTALAFTQFSSAASITGGDMITISSGVASVDLATVSGLESSNPGNPAGQLRVKLESSTPSLQIDGSNQLGISFDPTGAISAGLAGVIVHVDGTTTKINGSNNVEGLKSDKLVVALSGTDITNQYVDLLVVAAYKSVKLYVVGGGLQRESADYSVSYVGGVGSKTRVSFLNGLATGGVSELDATDTIEVSYEYL